MIDTISLPLQTKKANHEKLFEGKAENTTTNKKEKYNKKCAIKFTHGENFV